MQEQLCPVLGVSDTVPWRDGGHLQRGRVCLGIPRLLQDPLIAPCWSILRERMAVGRCHPEGERLVRGNA